MTRGWLAYLGSSLASELAVTAARLLTIPIHWVLFRDVVRARVPRAAPAGSGRAALRHALPGGAVVALLLASASTPEFPMGWPWTFALIFALDSVVVGVREELVYRGALQTLLERRMSLTRALVVSNLVFVVYHWRAFDFTPPRVLTIFLVGTALGLLYAGTGSLRVPILVHFAYDALIVLRPFVQVPGSLVAATVLSLALQLVAVALLVVWIRGARHV